MRKSQKVAGALALILTAIIIAAGGIDFDTAALPSATTRGNETPVRATKGDRLDAGPGIRNIAGVTFVLRDFDAIIR